MQSIDDPSPGHSSNGQGEKRGPWRRKVFRRLLQAGVFLFILGATLELAARFYVCFLADDAHLRQYGSLAQLKRRGVLGNRCRLMGHRYLGYCLTPGFVRGANKHNSLGYRGDEIVLPKPAGEFRIVCLGGSTTYDDCVEDYRLTYPSMLEKYLRERGYNVSVINAGTPGWSSYEDLINFEFRVSSLDVDMIIIYEAMNDLLARLVWPPEAYRGDNSGVRGPSDKSRWIDLYDCSTIVRMVLVSIGLDLPMDALEQTFGNLEPTYYGTRFAAMYHQPPGQDTTGPHSMQEALARNPPVYFERNIEDILVLAQHRNIRAVISTFVHNYDPKFKPEGMLKDWFAAFDQMNDVIRGLARRLNVTLFDLAKVFPEGRADLWAKDTVHNVEAGADLKARLFADFLCENQLVPERSKIR